LIPVGDNLGRRGFLPVTALVLLVWVSAFVWTWRLPSGARPAFEARFALSAPMAETAAMSLQQDGSPLGVATAGSVLTTIPGHALLHCSLLQLLTCALFFQVFGGRLEARAGRLRFLSFLLAAAVASGATVVWLSPHHPYAGTGATGVVTACLLAVLVMTPRLHLRCLVPAVFWPVFFELPLWSVLPVWVLLQVRPLQELVRLGDAHAVPWTAHIGGAAIGLLAGPLLLRPRRRALAAIRSARRKNLASAR